jgi:hypothetical protein
MKEEAKAQFPELGEPILTFADVDFVGSEHGFAMAEAERAKEGMNLVRLTQAMRELKVAPADYAYSMCALLGERHGGTFLPLRKPDSNVRTGDKGEPKRTVNDSYGPRSAWGPKGLKKIQPGNEFYGHNVGWVPAHDKVAVDGDQSEALLDLCGQTGLSLTNGLVQRSSSGNLHVIVKLPDELVPGR